MKDYIKDLIEIYESNVKDDDVLEEGKSGHGDEKAVKKLLKSAIKDGLVTVKETGHGWLVQSVNTPDQETIHKGERALHYLRRFLKKLS